MGITLKRISNQDAIDLTTDQRDTTLSFVASELIEAMQETTDPTDTMTIGDLEMMIPRLQDHNIRAKERDGQVITVDGLARKINKSVKTDDVKLLRIKDKNTNEVKFILVRWEAYKAAKKAVGIEVDDNADEAAA